MTNKETKKQIKREAHGFFAKSNPSGLKRFNQFIDTLPSEEEITKRKVVEYIKLCFERSEKSISDLLYWLDEEKK